MVVQLFGLLKQNKYQAREASVLILLLFDRSGRAFSKPIKDFSGASLLKNDTQTHEDKH